jgi:hypothetical protein
MELDDRPFTQETATPLVVADWKIDAEAVVTICRQRLAGASAVHVVVPAWLHGLDWAGDPFTSVPVPGASSIASAGCVCTPDCG